MMHLRAQPGTRIEETARLMEQIEQTVRATIRQWFPHQRPTEFPEPVWRCRNRTEILPRPNLQTNLCACGADSRRGSLLIAVFALRNFRAAFLAGALFGAADAPAADAVPTKASPSDAANST
jgi:hypothetical protein